MLGAFWMVGRIGSSDQSQLRKPSWTAWDAHAVKAIVETASSTPSRSQICTLHGSAHLCLHVGFSKHCDPYVIAAMARPSEITSTINSNGFSYARVVYNLIPEGNIQLPFLSGGGGAKELYYLASRSTFKAFGGWFESSFAQGYS